MKPLVLSCSFMLVLAFAGPGALHAGSATWSANPATGNWNMATNWAPNTVPNSPSDVATLGQSSNRNISISEMTDVDSIHFLPYTTYVINAGPGLLNFDGAGVISDEGGNNYFTVIQNFSTGGIIFHNSAKAGKDTRYLIAGLGSAMFFEDSSSADAATIELSQSQLMFYGHSSAGDAIIDLTPGGVSFYDDSSAGHAQFNLIGGAVDFGYNSTAENTTITASGYASISFTSTASAAQGHFTMNGGTSADGLTGAIYLVADASAGSGIFVVNGGSAPSAPGAQMNFLSGAHAGNATITVNGGTNGGEGAMLTFDKRSHDGGTASITLNGNGTLNLAQQSQVTTGSIAGDGLIFLGQNSFKIGSNNTSTKFTGLIQEGAKGTGGITKIGTGTWTLTGANTYVGGTTLIAGGLTINNKQGSGTGTGPVQVNGGTLAGSGVLTGATTLGTGSGAGALLAPGAGATLPVTLTVQSSLTFQADATLQVRLNTKKAQADTVAANGVLIGSGAQFVLPSVGQVKLSSGATFTVINNTSATPIAGTFGNLADGSILLAGPNKFQASYEGGDGNDLTLTVQ